MDISRHEMAIEKDMKKPLKRCNFKGFFVCFGCGDRIRNGFY